MFLAWGCFYCREVRPVIRVPTCTRSHFPLTWPVHKERFAHFLLFLPPNRFYTLYDVKLHIARNLMETRENIEIESQPFYHIVCDWFSWGSCKKIWKKFQIGLFQDLQFSKNRVSFENVLGMSMLLLSGSEASNTCSNMHTIPFSPDMAGPQGKFCPFSCFFLPPAIIFPILFL